MKAARLHRYHEALKLEEIAEPKALVARQGRLLTSVPEPAVARLGELSGPDAVRCRALRLELGIDASDDAPAFVRGDGTPVGSEELVRFRRTAGLTALSLETNGGMCRDLLRVRYEDHDRKEVAV